MTRTRKIIVHIATSADGYIARPDGGVDWLKRPRPPGNYGMSAFLRSIDMILWGRKTHETALRMGVKRGGFGPKVKNYVFSHRPPAYISTFVIAPSLPEGESPPPNVAFVNEPIRAFAQRLRVWMMGGGGVIASFLDEGEIDEFSIHVIPVFIGEGIPLIQPRHRLVPLKLRSVRRFPDGVVHLHYRVLPQTAESKTGRKIAQ